MVDWKLTQLALAARGGDPGAADGIPGPRTYGALLRIVAAPGANLNAIATACARHFPDYGMTTDFRIAEFLAQIANETGGFSVWTENLNYSAEALMRTWPGRFPSLSGAAAFARKPEAIANKVYGGRMGNDQPGDGWRFRGRGALQLTGRTNYRAASQRLGLPLEDQPDMAADPPVSVRIALDFWQRAKVNAAVDRGDFREARRLTNGGAIGLDHVAALRAKLLAVLA